MAKILFWLDTYFTYFGIAKFLQDDFDADLYAVIDTPDKPKRFFQNQKLIHFKNKYAAPTINIIPDVINKKYKK